MTIWFYTHECQIGDYVFADGTFSDLPDKRKTVVGICFYINPQNKANRLCVAVKNVFSYCWGLSATSWSEGISLKDDPEYNVFVGMGLVSKTNGTNSTINESTFRSPGSAVDADGFTIKSLDNGLSEVGLVEFDSDFGEYTKDSKLPWGQYNTLKVMIHRNKILNDPYISLPVPRKNETQTEYDNLLQCLQDIVTKNNNQTKYREFYYPDASQCFAYEPAPKEGEILSPLFQAGKWFLPSMGELGRIYWFNTHDSKHEPIQNGIFAKAIDNNIFTAMTNGRYWSSTAATNNNVLIIDFSSGLHYYNNRSTEYAVRPVAAF